MNFLEATPSRRFTNCTDIMRTSQTTRINISSWAVYTV